MNILFYFGPERIPFKLFDNGTIDSKSTIPFHGIISRGLLNKFNKHNLNHNLWLQYSHHLFDNSFVTPTNEFQEIQKLAQECEVLSFGQSAICAQKYIEHYCKEKKIFDAQIEIWNIKEGHTSSVWKTTVHSVGCDETFAINVARDQDAGVELKESSEKLKKINNYFPGINISKVQDIYMLQGIWLPSQVVITRNEWIDNASEIHPRTNKQTGKEELLMVERFLTNENNPAHITTVLGRIFSIEEVHKIEADLDDFLNLAATCLPDKPEINVYDGDVIWDGKKAIVVALN